MRTGLIIGILIFLIILVGAAFVFYVYFFILQSEDSPLQNVNVQDFSSEKLEKINKTEVGQEQINFVLYSIGASKLKKVPFTNNYPRIELEIGNETFNAVVIDSKIVTSRGEIDDEDIRLSTSKEEFIKILNSGELKKALQDAVANGDVNLEILAGKTELLAKGYLSLYKEITGKSLKEAIVK